LPWQNRSKTDRVDAHSTDTTNQRSIRERLEYEYEYEYEYRDAEYEYDYKYRDAEYEYEPAAET
jgi:hypothetical protein